MNPNMAGNCIGLKWKPEHDDMLTRLRSEGYSSSRIANSLAESFNTTYSRNAVIGRASRLGLINENRPVPRITQQRRDKPVRTTPFREPKVPRITLEEISLRCGEIVPRNLSLIELEPHDCRWPYGETAITFCGHPKMAGSSYCVPHFHKARGNGTASERRATETVAA